MKRNITRSHQRLLASALTLALVLGMGCTAWAADGTTTTRKIVTTGTGIVSVEPDTATATLSVQTKGDTANVAQTENNKIIAEVTATLKKMGIEEKQITTAYSAVYPNYFYDDKSGQEKISSYEANTTLNVKTKDIDNVGSYIDAALAAGATGFRNVSFSLENPTAYYAQALRAAVKNAGASAQAIAEAYGKPLGGIVSVEEHSSGNSYEEAVMAQYSSLEKNTAADAGGSPTTIQYSEVRVTAYITATYDF